MKRIETQEQKDKRDKRNQILVGVVMIGLLVLSTAGFAFMNLGDHSGGQSSNYGPIESHEYNGITFLRQETFWITQINQKSYAFGHIPEELADVEISITHTLSNFQNRPLYIVDGNGTTDIISYNLLPNFALRVNEACLSEESCDGADLPIKSCETDNMIIFQYENNEVTSVTQNQNCIIITGDKAKGTDKFLQQILSIS